MAAVTAVTAVTAEGEGMPILAMTFPIRRGPVPCLWRAPTDNDEFGGFAEAGDAGLDGSVARRAAGAWQPCAWLCSA